MYVYTSPPHPRDKGQLYRQRESLFATGGTDPRHSASSGTVFHHPCGTLKMTSEPGPQVPLVVVHPRQKEGQASRPDPLVLTVDSIR